MPHPMQPRPNPPLTDSMRGCVQAAGLEAVDCTTQDGLTDTELHGIVFIGDLRLDPRGELPDAPTCARLLAESAVGVAHSGRGRPHGVG
jgi:hypothetical protein